MERRTQVNGGSTSAGEGGRRERGPPPLTPSPADDQLLELDGEEDEAAQRNAHGKVGAGEGGRAEDFAQERRIEERQLEPERQRHGEREPGVASEGPPASGVAR